MILFCHNWTIESTLGVIVLHVKYINAEPSE